MMEEGGESSNNMNVPVDYNPHGNDDTNALIAPPKKKHNKDEGERKQQEPVRVSKMTAKKRRRVEAFKAKMAKQEKRKEVMASLQRNMLDASEFHLYHSSSNIGRKETGKQLARRIIQEQKAGITVTQDRTGRDILQEVEVDENDIEWEPTAVDDEEMAALLASKKSRKRAGAATPGDADGESVMVGGLPLVDEEREAARLAARDVAARTKNKKKGFFDKGLESKKPVGMDADDGMDEDEKEAEERIKRNRAALFEWAQTHNGSTAEDMLGMNSDDDGSDGDGDDDRKDRMEVDDGGNDDDEGSEEEEVQSLTGMSFGFGTFQQLDGVKVEVVGQKEEEEDEEEEGEGDDDNDDEGEGEDSDNDEDDDKFKMEYIPGVGMVTKSKFIDNTHKNEDDNEEEEDDDEDDDNDEGEDNDNEEDDNNEHDENINMNMNINDNENNNEEEEEEIIINEDEMIDNDRINELVNGETSKDTKKSRRKTLDFVEERITNVDHVVVNRPPDVEAARLNLPITMEEQGIMEAINDNDVTIVCGETGCGKTTQIPQFLYEAGYGSPASKRTPGMIGVTQPRRVAAVSMANRVAYELGLECGREVAYQIRYDSVVDPEHTRVKFMTDGVLLREIQFDFLLSAYSVIIIDEAHERNINTDILIGLLSKIVPYRNRLAKEGAVEGGKQVLPLKLVIMSATLRVEDFTSNKRMFPVPPPVVKVPTRQYPVTVHFNRKTVLGDYVGEAYAKVCKIHNTLPPGGILVFLTGQKEILHLCRRLRRKFPEFASNDSKEDKDEESDEKSKNEKESENTKDEKSDEKSKNEKEDKTDDKKDKENEDNFVANDEDAEDFIAAENDGEDDYDDDDDGDDDDMTVDPESLTQEERDQIPDRYQPLHVLPLYSALAPSRQREVFAPPPAGSRLVVVATNVAETALTIPGITYVVDCGRAKQRKYDLSSGISKFVVDWTSKASADQRAGRAGRTGPGHCYRIYSSAVFNDYFPKFSEPEILTTPIDGVVLQMKSMGIEKIGSFPFPTAPSRESIANSLLLLKHIGALDTKEVITPLGRSISKFPVNPRYAKMLVLAHRSGCLPWVVSIVAALSVRDLFTPLVNGLRDDNAKAKAAAAKGLKRPPPMKTGTSETAKTFKECKDLWINPDSDFLSALKAVEGCRHALKKGQSVATFCEKYCLHQQSLEEILKLRMQLATILSEPLDGLVPPPDAAQQVAIRQVITSGLIDQVAKRMTREELGDTKGPSQFAYKTLVSKEPIYIHPSSFMTAQAPEYVVYHEIIRSAAKGLHYMRGVTRIKPSWLYEFGPTLSALSQPLSTPPPRYDPQTGDVKCFAKVTYGIVNTWQLPMQLVSYPEGRARSKVFLQALLAGQVFVALQPFADRLVVHPSAIQTSTNAKVIGMVDALVSAGADSKAGLLRKWAKEPDFLLAKYLDLLEKPVQKQLIKIWPPLK